MDLSKTKPAKYSLGSLRANSDFLPSHEGLCKVRAEINNAHWRMIAILAMILMLTLSGFLPHFKGTYSGIFWSVLIGFIVPTISSKKLSWEEKHELERNCILARKLFFQSSHLLAIELIAGAELFAIVGIIALSIYSLTFWSFVAITLIVVSVGQFFVCKQTRKFFVDQIERKSLINEVVQAVANVQYNHNQLVSTSSLLPQVCDLNPKCTDETP